MINNLLINQTSKNIMKLENIIHYIWNNPGISRVEMERHFKWSRCSVGLYCSDLLNLGYIYDGKAAVKKQKSAPNNIIGLYVKSDLFYSIGISLSKECSKVALFDAQNNVVEEVNFTMQEDKTKTPEILKEAIENVLLNADKEKIVSIGIVITGVIDYITGEIFYSAAFEGCEKFNLKTFIKDIVGIEPFLINISHIKPIMEKRWGAAKNYKNFMNANMSSVGFYINNQPYYGATMQAGEMGLVKVTDKDSGMARDGRTGTLQTVAPFYKMSRKIEEMLDNGANLKIKRPNKSAKINMEMIIKAIEDGDLAIEKMMIERYELFAEAIINAVYLLNPEVIFLDNWCGRVPQCTVDVVKRKLYSYGVGISHCSCDVQVSKVNIMRLPEAAAILATEKALKENKE